MTAPQATTPPTALIAEDDCLHAMAHLPDASVDLVLCDLPYGTTQNAWDSVIPLDALWAQYQRIVRPGGTLALTSQGLFTARLLLSNEAEFKYTLCWVKSKATNFLNAKKQPLRKHEDVCVFVRKGGTPTYNPQMQPGEPYDKGVRKAQQTGSYGEFEPVRVKNDSGERYPADVVYFSTAESEGPVWHATQKPVALGRYLVRTYSNPGDVILDNACGSGSFCLAAALEDRVAIGIEQNLDVTAFRKGALDMVAIAAERLRAAGPVRVVRRDADKSTDAPRAAALEDRVAIGIEQNLDVTAFRKGALDMVAIAAERLRAAGPVRVVRRDADKSTDAPRRAHDSSCSTRGISWGYNLCDCPAELPKGAS